MVPFQNGVEAGAILERALGRRYVCGGVAYIAAAIEAPGVIRHTGAMARLLFGEADGSRSWRLETLQAACQGAGIDATLSPADRDRDLAEVPVPGPFAAITCLGRTTIGAVREDPMLWPRFMAMVAEAAAVARARGICPRTSPRSGSRSRGLPTEMRSSMLHDLEAGRRLELDGGGAVLRLGGRSRGRHAGEPRGLRGAGSLSRRPPRAIAQGLCCAVQTVRNAIRAFNARGLAALTAGSSRPKSAAPVLDGAKLEQLRAILHQSPRAFGHARSTWTLALLAQVAHEQGLSATVLSDETIRQALARLEVGWKRAKRWLTSPDPDYARKKVAATA